MEFASLVELTKRKENGLLASATHDRSVVVDDGVV